MKYLIPALLFSFIAFNGVFAQQEGHDIVLEIKGIEADTAYLGYHLDGKTYIQDTVQVVNEEARFKSDEQLEAGMYFLYTPNGIFFEFLIKDQFFSIKADKSNIPGTAVVSGSKEVELFINLQRQMTQFQKESRDLQQQLSLPQADSAKIIDQIRSKDAENKKVSRNLAQENSGTLFSQVITLMDRPSDIEAPEGLDERDAQIFIYQEYKRRFWEEIDLTEAGIVRTPLFLPRLKEYFEKVVPTHPDSLNAALDGFLSRDMAPEVFQYSLMTMVNLYANSKIMGMDAVYVHLVDNYYAKGKATWTDETTLTRMKQNSSRIRTLLIGKPAPDFSIPDVDGNLVSPLSLPEDYVILFIYDSGCGHCKKAAPKMVTAYENLKNSLSIDLLTVNLSENETEWKEFIEKYGLSGTNLGDLAGTSNIGYYYYVNTTPQIYILDKERKIIAKKLGAGQIEDFFSNYLKVSQ